ncbi:NAD(P)/FAD-dependent oxidoreductase [Alteraurantiacibacter aquimixticola]|uniref:FAD-binding oxidoreductase n=1 Tax=Alteraurantiacibacter aquimixticola TaxID=2489173 RepID=A0A4V4U8T8_9SPHN|nr:FAD-dependent oxidoreductase [Alteraurantiacibacter aquimixticola]TIX51327.1 FAD-binding oxidoreductase [Alteraurantiacibacter aquimixticola]
MNDTFDIVVIGAGIAGASLAAELAPHASVLLAEAERMPGYHSTGRSAAFWDECYGGPGVVPLTLASGPWLKEHGFLSPRGAVHLATADQLGQLDSFEQEFSGTGVSMNRLDRAGIDHRIPGLRDGWVEAIEETECADIDVGGVHQHYLASGKRAGVELRTGFRLQSAEWQGGGWLLTFENGEQVSCGVLANAAGAWVDEVARMAGAQPLGITPYRRTVVQLRTAPAPDPDLPLVLGIDGSFYFKPDGARVWLSPHDETPSPAADVAAEELDVAIAIDRFEKVVDWKIEAVERKWAGLRSFAPDRMPVYGHDPASEGLFWFAGQGGFGIQTAPAAARLASQLLLGLSRDHMTATIDTGVYSPARFG